jgi:hypothetical protein
MLGIVLSPFEIPRRKYFTLLIATVSKPITNKRFPPVQLRNLRKSPKEINPTEEIRKIKSVPFI